MLEFIQAYPDLTDAIGVAGFLAYIAGFHLVQTGRICGNGIAYAVANVIAAALVLISLANAFNIASFLIQVSFILIGLIGIARKLHLRNRANSMPEAA